MDTVSRQLVPAAPLEKSQHAVVNVADVSDSPSQDGSSSNSPESRSSLSAPSTGNEETKIITGSINSPLGFNIQLAALYAENVVAKIWKVAVRELENENPPTRYPEYVPSTGPDANLYKMTEAEFWTCGFFPGSLYAILERAVKYPQFLFMPNTYRPSFSKHLLDLCRTWSDPLRNMKTRTDTHDMGFMMQPALRMDWELTGNTDSLECIIAAAYSLASRFDQRVGAIRSWDDTRNHRYSFTDMKTNFLVIIDSMCNLDLLYYAGHLIGDQKLIDVATTHAHTVLREIVRDDWSTYHLVNFDPKTGNIKNKMTNQGYQDWSTWSRGQAWAIVGFTQTYTWTRSPIFLHAAISLSSYFLSRLTSCPHAYPCVPPWDFDAPPTTSTASPLRDTSAGMIAANGMLLLHQILIAENRRDEAAVYLEAVLRVVQDTLAFSLAPGKSTFAAPSSLTPEKAYPVVDEAKPGEPTFDAILKHSTANNNEFSYKRHTDHGLVYADYYFLELGNKFLRMGLL